MKKHIVDLLRVSICDVKFKKVSGTERLMKATLMKDIIPADMQPPKVTPAATMRDKANDNVVSCWDVEANGWRSFRLDLLMSIEWVSVDQELKPHSYTFYYNHSLWLCYIARVGVTGATQW